MPARSKSSTRRAFRGLSLCGLRGAVVTAVAGPTAVYLLPRGGLSLRNRIRVALDRPLGDIADGSAVRFDSPPGMAFTMADGGEGNAAGDRPLGGFGVRDGGPLGASRT